MKKKLPKEKLVKKERRWRRFFKISITSTGIVGVLCLLAVSGVAVYDMVAGNGKGTGPLSAAEANTYYIQFAKPIFTDSDIYHKTAVSYVQAGEKLHFSKGQKMEFASYPEVDQSGVTPLGTTYTFSKWSLSTDFYIPWTTKRAYLNYVIYALYDVSYFAVQPEPEPSFDSSIVSLSAGGLHE